MQCQKERKGGKRRKKRENSYKSKKKAMSELLVSYIHVAGGKIRRFTNKSDTKNEEKYLRSKARRSLASIPLCPFCPEDEF
jgi:hypothetical protein